MQTKQTVWVGLSGGVDSSVSAALLLQQGYNVVGVYLKTWQPDFIECTWQQDRRDAMRVAAVLGIPFITIDVEEEYKRSVADYMINEYKAGRTPNPDIMCNREIKFGVFFEKARAHGADFIATGHYVNRVEVSPGSFELRAAKDATKDQSYFLWAIPKNILPYVLFPLGNYTKKEVRVLATRLQLPTATKKDSQGVCMLGEFDIKEFLKHFITTTPGSVLDIEGNVIGYHDGALFFTLGERHGFTINKKTSDSERVYIVARDIEKNTITVSSQPKTVTTVPYVALEQVSLFDLDSLSQDQYCEAQVRYQGVRYKCRIVYTPEHRNAVVYFDDLKEQPASGQSIVFYRKNICLGGGIVK